MMKSNMVQYGVWPNCNNNCAYCLRQDREFFDDDMLIMRLEQIKKNIHHIDWSGKFSDGISLLGGELFYIKSKRVQDVFLTLIDTISEVVFKQSPCAKLSIVSNGIYKPDFLFTVIDYFLSKGHTTKNLDFNFSYDIKYRYASKSDENQVLSNIKEFSKRYDYTVGIQMILTQYVMDMDKFGSWGLKDFVDEYKDYGNFVFLYPHPILTGCVLDDFFFKRKDLLEFVTKYKDLDTIHNFILSTLNSCTYKYSGLYLNKSDETEQPVLSKDKADLSTCGHSTLYMCYSDSKKCMLCDLLNLNII